jgi:hypothetical protein
MFVADLYLSYPQHSETIPLLAKAVHGKSDSLNDDENGKVISAPNKVITYGGYDWRVL